MQLSVINGNNGNGEAVMTAGENRSQRQQWRPSIWHAICRNNLHSSHLIGVSQLGCTLKAGNGVAWRNIWRQLVNIGRRKHVSASA